MKHIRCQQLTNNMAPRMVYSWYDAMSSITVSVRKLMFTLPPSSLPPSNPPPVGIFVPEGNKIFNGRGVVQYVLVKAPLWGMYAVVILNRGPNPNPIQGYCCKLCYKDKYLKLKGTTPRSCREFYAKIILVANRACYFKWIQELHKYRLIWGCGGCNLVDVWKIQHEGWSQVINTVQGEAKCCIWHETSPQVFTSWEWMVLQLIFCFVWEYYCVIQ